MDNVTKELLHLRDANPEVALIMDAYKEAERVYRDAVMAMGVTSKQAPVSNNTAQVTIPFRDIAPSIKR